METVIRGSRPTNWLEVTAEFLAFVTLARESLQALERPLQPRAFDRFVARVTPLVLDPLRAQLADLAPRLAKIRRWIISADLLSTAGLAWDEDAYTELVAWALHPDIHPSSASARQRAWLERAPFANEIDFRRPATPQTQRTTADGVPDIVFDYNNCVLVVEAKTGTEEHMTPGGQYQTLAYPPAVAKALHLAPSTPIHTVFLTISGKTAKNPDAFATTFVEFTLRTMSALEASGGAMPAADVRFAFSMLFTHFLTAAVPVGVDLRRVIQLFDNWESRLTDIKFLEKHMNEIAESMNALPLEVRHG